MGISDAETERDKEVEKAIDLNKRLKAQ